MTRTSDNASTRSWFITGASSGIGRELRVAALARGDAVAALARRADALDDPAGRYPGRLLAVRADVRDEQSVRDAVKATVDAFTGSTWSPTTPATACSAPSRRPPVHRHGRSSTRTSSAC